jgi:hypothetical protein
MMVHVLCGVACRCLMMLWCRRLNSAARALVSMSMFMPAGVLLCACTEAARKQLSRDFASATDAGAAAVASQASPTAGAAEQAGGQAEPQRPLGKQYRALVAGLMAQDEVRHAISIVCRWW